MIGTLNIRIESIKRTTKNGFPDCSACKRTRFGELRRRQDGVGAAPHRKRAADDLPVILQRALGVHDHLVRFGEVVGDGDVFDVHAAEF